MAAGIIQFRPAAGQACFGLAQFCFMGPGIDSQQVLEMSNFGPVPLAVYPGTPICQFVFQRMDGEGHYRGVFTGQTAQSF